MAAGTLQHWRSAWRRTGLEPRSAALAAGATGVGTLVVVALTGTLYLVNLHGPVPERPGLGGLAALGCGVVAGAVAFAPAWWIARRSRRGLIALVGFLCVACWALFPREIDVSESWVPESNPRWSCSGWSFWRYPPGLYDGNDVEYCIGFEKRIPDG